MQKLIEAGLSPARAAKQLGIGRATAYRPRRRNAPRSFFAFNVILGTNLPMTPRRSLQRIAPMPGGASKTLEITFSVDFIVEEGTNRILWVDSNPYTYPT